MSETWAQFLITLLVTACVSALTVWGTIKGFIGRVDTQLKHGEEKFKTLEANDKEHFKDIEGLKINDGKQDITLGNHEKRITELEHREPAGVR